MAQNHLGLSDEDILSIALSYVGFDEERQAKSKEKYNHKRFRAFYGIGHQGIRIMIEELVDIVEVKCDLKKICMTLHWMKTYSTETHMSGYWKCSEKTVRESVFCYAKAIRKLKEHKVRHLRH
jgi:hypothetical protein